MKVPPKRKGNPRAGWVTLAYSLMSLNESPSEKEGKSSPVGTSSAGEPVPQ